jgi:hypothetical protein
MATATRTKSALAAAQAELDRARADLAEARSQCDEIDAKLLAGEKVEVDDYADANQRRMFHEQEVQGLEARVAKEDVAERVKGAEALRAEYQAAAQKAAEKVVSEYEAAKKALSKVFEATRAFNDGRSAIGSRAAELQPLHPEDAPRELKTALAQIAGGTEQLSAVSLAAQALLESSEGNVRSESERAIILALNAVRPTPAYVASRAEEIAKAPKSNGA